MSDLQIHPAATRHQFRAQVCRLIDRLITVLDDIDGDPDLEPAGDDEPSLSAAVPTLSWQSSHDGWIQGSDDDREDACEDEGAEHDGREPEEDNDTSDCEASLCGVSFGIGTYSALDGEGTGAAFTLDQSAGVWCVS